MCKFVFTEIESECVENVGFELRRFQNDVHIVHIVHIVHVAKKGTVSPLLLSLQVAMGIWDASFVNYYVPTKPYHKEQFVYLSYL